MGASAPIFAFVCVTELIAALSLSACIPVFSVEVERKIKAGIITHTPTSIAGIKD